MKVDFFALPLEASGNDKPVKLESMQSLQVGFKISDSESGYGVSDLHPAGWIFPRGKGQKRPDNEQCRESIKKFARGGVSVKTEGDLNNYYLLTINEDNTIAILNPSINLATSNLLALIPLKGKVGQWLFDQLEGRVYVSLPEDDKVAVVDVFSRKLVDYIKTGKQPGQIEKHGNHIFVANGGGGTVSVIDSRKAKLVQTLRLGKKTLTLVSDKKSNLMFAIDSIEGKVTVVSTLSLKKLKSFPIRVKGKIRSAYSALSQALYIVNSETGEMKVYLHENGAELASHSIKPGIRNVKASPDGRFVFVLNERENTVEVMDASSNQVVHKFKTWEGPYHIDFSSNFAYLRYKGNPNISLIQLSALKESSSAPFADVQMGTEGPGAFADMAEVSPLAIMPEGGGAMVVNPTDKVVYYYMESGMLAPYNSFKTYTASPLGVAIYDHSLKEEGEPGVYTTSARFPHGGYYDAYFYLPAPQVTACFELFLEGPSEIEKKEKYPGRFVAQSKKGTYAPRSPEKIRFKLLDSKTSKPIDTVNDVRILGFAPKGFWQSRKWAKSIGNGIYEAEFIFPKEGQYNFLVESPGMGIPFDSKSLMTIEVEAHKKAETKK